MKALRARPLMHFGAGIAVTVVAAWSLSSWQASASISADESTFVSVTPARVLDTRSDLGLPGPFVSAIPQDLKITGSVATANGNAVVVVPDGATGVVLNVTAVNPGADGFVTIRPADAPGAPTTSNLNFKAGDIIPNSVTVQVPTSGADAGRIEITYDAFGNAGPTTEILIDIVGYTKNAGLASLQAQVNQLQARIDQFSQVDVSDVVFDGDPAGGALIGTYPSPGLANGSVDSSKVLDGTLTAADLTANSVTGAKVLDGTLTAADLAANSVTGAKVLDGTLTAADLAANSVTNSKIGDTEVTGAKVLDGALTDLDLADNSVLSGEIGTGAVGADEVAANSLTVDDLDVGSVGASELVDHTVGMTEMNAVIGDDVPVDSDVALGAGQCDLNKVIAAPGAAALSRVLVLVSRLQDGAVVNTGWIAYGGHPTADVDTVNITVCNHTGAAAANPPPMEVSFIAIGP